MSELASESGGPGPEHAYGVWMYAVTEGASPPGLGEMSGVGGAAVRAVPCGELWVLVSDVPLAEFGAAALRRNLEDLDWLETVARQHHDVIGAAARLFPLLPARLVTVYSSESALREHLTARAEPVRAQLDYVAGRAEWGVKAYAASSPDSTAGDQARAGEQPGDGDEPGDGSGAGAGLAYLKRRRAQLTAGRERQASAAASAEDLHAQLTARAAGARLHPPQSPQLTGIREPMLLNAAYLVDDTAREDFVAAVTDTAAACPGLYVELTGPWPPYSFAGDGGGGGGGGEGAGEGGGRVGGGDGAGDQGTPR